MGNFITVYVLALLLSPHKNKAEVIRRIRSVLDYVDKELKLAVKNKPIRPIGLNPYYALNTRQVSQLAIRLKQTLIDLSPRGSEYWNYANSVRHPFKPDSVANLFGILMSLLTWIHSLRTVF